MAKYNHEWHNDQCVRSQEYFKRGRKHFFCLTHGQWASEVPVEIVTIYTYGDGTKIEVKEK